MTAFWWVAMLVLFVVGMALFVWVVRLYGATVRDDRLAWAGLLVAAAEQMFPGRGQGPRRLEYALEQMGLRFPSLDDDQARAMVEAAVFWQGSPTGGGIIRGELVEVWENEVDQRNGFHH